MHKNPNGSSNGSVNFSLFKTVFQWLANCGIEDSVSMHVNVLRQNYYIIDLQLCNALQYTPIQAD